jgi:hypothetical protein
MAVQKKKSNLAARLGEKARKVFNEVKDQEPEFDTQAGLPGGIEGGIAQLVECKFTQIAAGKQNAGKDMFYAAGVVVSPSEVNGINIKGLRTQISEPLYDTPTRSRKTVDDHLEWVMNEMKKLGLDMSEMDLDDLEGATETLKEEKPYFRFRTWSGTKQEIVERGGKFFVGTMGPYKTEAAAKAANPYAGTEPRVQHTWNGTCEYFDDEEELDGVEDNTSFVKASKTAKKTKASVAEEEVEEEDLAELAAAADGGDTDAAERLFELATEAGLDEETVNSTEEWSAIVEMMQSSSSNDEEEKNEEKEDVSEEEEEEEEADEEEEWEPEKGEVYAYKAPGMKKAIDCEVTAVFESKETVNLKNLNDNKIYKSAPWDKLIK